MDVRIDNPTEIDERSIATEVADGNRLVLQYSKPPYDSRVLARADELAKQYGRSLQIRFYGHYSEGFDCTVLNQVPNAVSLAIDCLHHGRNLDALSELNALEELSFGIYELVDRDFLRFQNLTGLSSLSLSETKTKALDLSHLKRFQKLGYLHVTGHTKNIEVLTELDALQELSLSSIPKRIPLAFVNQVQALTSLGLILGGRPDIADINHSGLRELEVVRVQGLSDLTNLGRFPLLEKLRIEDQIRIANLDFAKENSQLRELVVANCKTLESLNGLRNLRSLQNLRLSKTALNLDTLIEAGLPDSLEVFGYFPGTSRGYDAGRQKLDELGYREFSNNTATNKRMESNG